MAVRLYFKPLPLSAAEHYERLHHDPHGTVLLWEARKRKRRWTKIEPWQLPFDIFGGRTGQRDVFFSVNQFYGWRLVKLLRSLRACYVDVDGCTNLLEVEEALENARLPLPTLVIFSGRGLHLYWLLEPVPARALPVWQRMQDVLWEALKPLGADSRARDCTRVLRLIGTVNSKNGAVVRGLVFKDWSWDFRSLADEILGPRVKPATVVDFKAAVARRGRAKSPNQGCIYDWWHLVYTDLCQIAEWHWSKKIPEGRRDTLLFLMANALSWFAHSEALEQEILHTAQSFTPTLTRREVETYTKPIVKRARAASAGEHYEWLGRKCDPRYAFRAETLREWLGEELLPPELWPSLRALAPKEVIRERKREREKNRAPRDRVAEGRYQQHRKDFLQKADERKAEALRLRESGLSWREVGEQMGISANAAETLARRAPKKPDPA